ncbi:MAG: spore cortex biosynthesis protein YabQ [Bacillota bacterium]|nr:spore cortex biosynthesis protein YabQ [Thermoanaerobacteraceae bacterium]
MPGLFSQLEGFGVSLAIGVGGGWLFDLCQVFSQLKKRSRFLRTFSDVSFWLTFTSLAAFFIFVADTGEVRFYTLLGIATGFLCHRQFFRRYSTAFSRFLGKTLAGFLDILERPFLLFFRLFRRLSSPFRRRRAAGPEPD